MVRSNVIKGFLILILFVVVAGTGVWVPKANAVDYTISGTVKDASGNAMQDVVVTFKDSPNRVTAYTGTTNQSGTYIVTFPSAGDYELTGATKTGYERLNDFPAIPIALTVGSPTYTFDPVNEVLIMRPVTGPEPYVLNLKLNWNLISLPHQPDNTAIATVLTEIANHYVISWSYPSQHWKYYDPNDTEGSTFNTMEAGKAYWVKTTGAYTMTVAGTTASPTVELLQNWNFVGYTKDTVTPIGTALGSILNKYTIVWGYVENSQNPTQNQWKYYDPNDVEGSTLLQMSPGYGYWIKATQPATLTYP